MNTTPLDQTQDISDRETHRLTTLFPRPEFVKNASRDRTHGDETLPRHVYADVNNKLYPCHTAAATWLSALFFTDKRANFDQKTADSINARIQAAAKYFGIVGTIAELQEKVADAASVSLEKLSDDHFAIVWQSELGPKDRMWPLRNATEVSFAAHHFNKHRGDFRYEDRQKIAEKILVKAAEYAADIGEHQHMLELTAGHGACATKVATEMLRSRATLVWRRNKEAAAEMFNLADVLDNNPEKAREHGTRLKLAAAVDEFDRVNHLDRLYTTEGGLLRAEEVLFAVTEKAAHDFMSENVETTTGNVYALTDLEKLAVEDVRNWLGDEFADAVSAGGVFLDQEKLAAIVPTLDRGMAATLDRLMQEKNLGPVVQTKAAESLLPLEQLFALANQND